MCSSDLDDAWEPAGDDLDASAAPPAIGQARAVVHLPLIVTPPALPPTEFRPLGIFDTASGRMVGYIP